MMNLFEKLYKYKVLILFSPILLNFIFNLFSNNTVQTINLRLILLKVLTIALFSTAIYLIGSSIKSVFNIDSVSSAVVFYIITFYIVNFYLLVFLKSISTKHLFVAYQLILIVILISKSRRTIKPILTSFLILFSLNIVLNYFQIYELLYFEDFRSSDEINFWYPKSVLIAENNLLQIYTGYSQFDNKSFGLLVHYSFVFLEMFFNFEQQYLFTQIVPNIIFVLFTYFLFENFKYSLNRLYLYLTVIILFLTSDWFSYFMLNSHLGETFTTFFYGVLFFSLLKNKDNKRLSFFYLFFLSNLIYTKRFMLALVIISIITYLFLNRKYLYQKFLIIVSVLLPIVVNFLFLKVPILWTIDSEPMAGTQFEGFNFNFESVFKILDQFFIDKPVSYFVFVALIIIIFSLKSFDLSDMTVLIVLILNTIFVFLYFFIVSDLNNAWGDAYRYLLNPFYLILFFINKIIDSGEKSNV